MFDKIFKTGFGILAVALLFAVLPAFTPSPPAADYTLYRPLNTADTITDAEIDTISISPNLLSFWKFNHTIKGDQLTGTISLILIIQESNETTGTDNWYEVSRDTLTVDGGVLRLNGEVYGVRQRILIQGTGTQSSAYDHRATFKRDY